MIGIPEGNKTLGVGDVGAEPACCAAGTPTIGAPACDEVPPAALDLGGKAGGCFGGGPANPAFCCDTPVTFGTDCSAGALEVGGIIAGGFPNVTADSAAAGLFQCANASSVAR